MKSSWLILGIAFAMLPIGFALADSPEEARVDRMGARGVAIRADRPHTFDEYLSGAGDVNADGFDDFTFGAGFSDAATALFDAGPGRVYIAAGGSGVFSGGVFEDVVDVESIGAERRGLIIEGAVDGEHLGKAVEFLGDANGDGFGDLLIGSPSTRGWQAGAVYLLFGFEDLLEHPATTIADLRDAGRVVHFDGIGANSSVFGTSSGAGGVLAAPGDLDGDGLADFLISSNGARQGAGQGAGHVYVLFGREDFPATLELPAIEANGFEFLIDGGEPEQFVGNALVPIDWTGDGRPEIAFGSHGKSQRGTDRVGSGYVVEHAAFTSRDVFVRAGPRLFSEGSRVLGQCRDDLLAPPNAEPEREHLSDRPRCRCRCRGRPTRGVPRRRTARSPRASLPRPHT